MKKIKLSVAALLIALTVNAQETVNYQDEVTCTRLEVIEIKNT